MSKKSFLFLAASAVLALAGLANAVEINNSGFEEPVLTNGDYTTGAPPGWELGNYNVLNPTVWIPGWSEAGVWNPDTADGYSGGAAFEGQNVGYVASYTGSDAGFSQVLTVKLTADTEYVLSAAVGNPFYNGSDVSADYRLELLAGGVLLDSDTGASPASGDWAHHSLTYNSGHSPAQLGQPLEIRLIAVDYTDGGGSSWYEVDFDSVTLTLRAPIATNPNPADGAEHDDDWVFLSWTEGIFAVEHDVYFGTDEAAVTDANENDPMGPDEIYKARQTDDFYDVYDLVPGTTYYWRIDEVNDANSNSPWKGQVWSFWLAPWEPRNPSPPDGAIYMDPNIDLSWSPGFKASMHEVFFGTDPCSLDSIYRSQPNTCDPGPLLKETTYYWRVKEYQPQGRRTLGPIWSFTTTLTTMGTILYEYWDGITPTGNSLSLLYNWPDFPGNPTGTQILTLFEGPTDRANQFGARMRAWLYAPVTGDYKFWIATDDNGELWLSSDANPFNKQLISTCGLAGVGWAAPQNWSDPDVTPSGLIHLVAGQKYYIEGLMKEGGGDNIAVGWTTPFDSTIQVIPGGYLELFMQWWAWDPSPVDGAPEASRPITLRWQAGSHAAQHDVYFGASEASMTLQDTLPVGTEEYDPGTLDPGQTYYWKVNEVNVAGPDPCMWEGEVWSFTTSDYLVVEDFESYQYAGSSSDPNGARYVWKDGWSFFGQPAVKSGSNLMLGGIDEHPRPYLHYNGYRTNPYDSRQVQGMVFYYDNDGNTSVPGWPGYVYPAPKYSEMEAATTGINGLGFGRDWLREDRRSLSLWFRGHPARDGSFSYTGSGLGPYTATIISDGTDIWNVGPNPYHDEFHYAYLSLLGSGGYIGTGSIIARIDSVENTNGWAKAGVMMRASLAVDANHATVVVTPGQGVSFQYRDVKRGASTTATQGGITAPHWVRLQRDTWGTFYAYHANDAEHALAIWNPVNNVTSSQVSIYMDPNIYVGLALTSHNAAQMCTAQFSGVEFQPDTGKGSSVAGPWQSRDIGIISNNPEPLYLALQDTSLNVGIVKHNDPNAALIETWTEWNIDLADGNFASLDMHNIDKVYIGLGDRNSPTTGGKGVVYFDDIRLYPTRCLLSLRSPDFARVDYVPDCVVDYKELAVMAGDWLVQATDPCTGNLVGWWKLDDANGATAQDSSIYGNHGTLIAMNPASDWVTGRIGGALHFDGIDDYVDCANDVSLQITGTDISLAAWVKYETAADDSAIAMKTSSGDWIDGYGLYADSDAVNFYVTDYGFSATKSFTADDQWHHVVGTYDGSNVRVWVDAVEGTPVSYTGSISNAAHSFEIGRGVSNSYNFSGALDDVRLYNVALTDTDILGLLLLGLQTNLYEDMNIDFNDFAELAVWWLDEQLVP